MGKNNKQQNRVDSRLTGYIGECYVAYQLALRGIKAQRMDNFVVNYDFITKEGVRIEVKAAKPIESWNGQHTSTSIAWHWNNGKDVYDCKGGALHKKVVKIDRDCDFFIFVGLNEDGTTKKVYIVPKEIVGDRQAISEPVDRKRDGGQGSFRIYQYENKWNLISENK